MTCGFYKQPMLQPIVGADGKVVENLLMLAMRWMFSYNGRPWWIPSGYTFDGASIYKIFWWLIDTPFHPRYWAAALVHDYLYLTHLLPRWIADEIFRRLLIQCGVSRARARTMWLAVRSPAGALAWRNSRADCTELGRVIGLAGQWDSTYGYIPQDDA